jgi:integrase/recombinase XerD
MPRKGQRVKHHRIPAKKHPGPPRYLFERDDPIRRTVMARYMEDHCEWMAVSGYSAHTIDARRVAIRRFIAWCRERDLDDPRAITKPILERYQRHLFYYRKEDGKPLTLGTQFGCLAPLKTFFKWLARENHILYNPASEIELPKQPQRLPRALLSVQEIEAILAEAEPKSVIGLRDRAMLEVLYSTGLRRMELCSLKRYDVDVTRELVFVREGKGGRDRVVPLGARAAAWVERYLAEVRPELAAGETEYLFVTDHGEPMTAYVLANKVKRYMAFAGIEKPGACHLFRHACATHMLENGADIRFIQALLGHAKLETTQIYTHVSIEKLKEIHAATHPARLKRPGSDESARSIEETPHAPPLAADARSALLSALDAEGDQDDDADAPG